jgi:hypothetical protein
MPQYWTPQALGPLAKSESGGNASLIHYPNNPAWGGSGGGSSATGLYGFTTRTWQSYAQQAGVDINQYPYAYLAPASVQTQVALQTPISNWTCPGCNSTASALAGNPANVSGTPQSDGSGYLPSDPAAGLTTDPFGSTTTLDPQQAPAGQGNPVTNPAGTLPQIGAFAGNWFVRIGVIGLGVVLIAAAAFHLAKQSQMA